MKRWMIGGLVVWSILGAACQAGERGASEGIASDYPVADLFASAKDTFRLSAEALLVVGRNEALPLHLVRAALFLGDHTIIANSGPAEILILDQEGQLLHRRGRKGAGPGEFIGLAGLSRYRDGLVAWDSWLSRLSILDAEGKYVSSTTVRPRSGTSLVGAVGDNVLLHWSANGFPGEGAVGPVEVRLDEEFMILSPEDAKIVGETTLPGMEQWVKREQKKNGSRSHGGPPIIFGRDAVAAASGGRAYLGTTDSLVLTVYARDGNPSSVLSMSHTPIAVDPEWEQLVRDSLRRTTEARGPSPLPPMSDGRNLGLVLKEFRLELLEDLPARSTLPAFSDLKGGADGRLWIREYPTPVQQFVVWIGLSQSGEPEKRLEIPVGFNVQDISERRVIVLAKGRSGEDIVEVYEIEPTRAVADSN